MWVSVLRPVFPWRSRNKLGTTRDYEFAPREDGEMGKFCVSVGEGYIRCSVSCYSGGRLDSGNMGRVEECVVVLLYL